MGLKTVCSLLLLGALVTPTNAADLSDIEVVVTTATRSATDHRKLIGNTSVIDETLLLTQNPQHLNQVLGYAANLWLSRGNGQESLLAMRSPVLTGAGSCAEFVTMADGIPLRSAGFCNVNQLFDTHFEVATKVEAVKGNNSAHYGSNAIFGVINVSGIEHSDISSLSLNIGANEFTEITARTSYAAPNHDTSVALTLSHDGGLQENTGYNQQKLSLLSSHSLGDFDAQHRIHFSNLEQQSAGYLQLGKDAYKNKEYLYVNQFPGAYRNATAFTYQMNNQRKSDKDIFEVTPYIRFNEMDFSMHFLPGAPIEENGHHSVGVNLKQQVEINTSITLDLGLDSEYSNGFLRQTQAAPLQSGSAFLQAVLPEGKHYDFSVKAYNLAAYGALNATLSDVTKLALALRYDLTRYDYHNKMISGNTRDDGTNCGFGGCRYTRPSDSQDNFHEPSFSIGINHKINDATYAFAKFDSSFRAPHTNELYRLQNNQQRADITSVKATQQEFGVRYINDALFSEFSVFSLKKRDGIYQDQTRQYLNGLATHHKGVELDLSLTLSDAWSLRTNASYSLHTYQSNPLNSDINIVGNLIDTAPKLMATSQLAYTASNNVALQLSANYLDSYYLDSENLYQYGGHTLVNMSGQWQISESLSASFNLNNLFDRRYAERADYAFGEYRYFVGQPRSLYVKLRYQFN